MPKHASNVPNGISDQNDERSQEESSQEESSQEESSQDTEPQDEDLQEEGSQNEDLQDASVEHAKAIQPVGEGAHAGGFSYRGDNDAEYPDAVESLEPVDAPPLLFGDEIVPVEPEEPMGRHGKKEKQLIPPYQRKSSRMRRILVVIIVLLILLIVALGYFTFRLFDESKTLATQQAQEQQSTQEVPAMQGQSGETKDAGTSVTKKTNVPNLVATLGLTQDEAVVVLKHGATVTGSKEVSEENNPIKKNVTVALTDEPADMRSGTPTVYLGLDEDGEVIQAGYSAATASLGYGSLSFVDAVENERIVEKTLQEAGIGVMDDSAVLPDGKAEYSTYDTDGTTLTKENYSFSGSIDLDGAEHEWSATLLYNYATANMSGNLADTIRIIYVYINA